MHTTGCKTMFAPIEARLVVISLVRVCLILWFVNSDHPRDFIEPLLLCFDVMTVRRFDLGFMDRSKSYRSVKLARLS